MSIEQNIDLSGCMRTIAIANQKGGVGKTTTAINLSTALAAIHQKVLIFDLDPQGNASTGLGISRSDRQVNSYQVLIGEAGILDAIHKTEISGLDIVPSGIDLYGAEIELVDMEAREYCLRKALTLGAGAYDYIFIDCPPALNLLTLNALSQLRPFWFRCSASFTLSKASANWLTPSIKCGTPSIPPSIFKASC